MRAGGGTVQPGPAALYHPGGIAAGGIAACGWVQLPSSELKVEIGSLAISSRVSNSGCAGGAGGAGGAGAAGAAGAHEGGGCGGS